MAEKITKRDNFTTIQTILTEMGKTDLADVMAHEIELLDKKKSSKGSTKTQVENEGIKATILTVLGESAIGQTVTELQSSSDELKDYSNQKISSLLRQLVESGEVVKSTDKKKSYFSLA